MDKKVNIKKLAAEIKNLKDYENAGLEINETIDVLCVLTGKSRDTTLSEFIPALKNLIKREKKNG